MSLLLPWRSLVAIIWLQCISGTNTDFPAYSSELKGRLGITQVQLNNLAVASDAGKLLGWCSGVAAAQLPLWSVLAIGSTIGFIGYGIQFLFLGNKIATLSYWQYLLLQVLAGNSICWFNTACYVTAMRNFPVDHQFVVGLSTSYTGLSAKIYIAIAQVILGRNSSNKSIYLLLNCLVPLGVSLVAASFLKEREPARSGTMSSLLSVFLIAGATGACTVVQTLVPVLDDSVVLPMILLLMVGLVAVVPLHKALREVPDCDGVQIGVAEEAEPRIVEHRKEALGGSSIREFNENEEKLKQEGGTLGVWKLVKSIEFWLYFLVYLCGATMGLVYANNLGQIAQSWNVREAILLSISSSFSFFGRLSSAPLSLFTRNKYTVSRPAIVAILMMPTATSFFLLLNPSKVCLFISTAIIGACTGAITSIAVSMTSDLFGPENFSVNHNLVIANIPVGSLLFGYIAAQIYDEGGGQRGVCIGVGCYRTTFIILGSICSFGAFLSFILYLRTRNLSKR